MSINQISTANTFGQLVTAVSAIIAVANNFTDGPQSQTDSTWTFTNSGVGVNVPNTALFGTANVGTLNASVGNVTGITIGTANISTANITVANVGGATIGNVVVSSRITTTNANVNFIQVDDRANIFSLNAQTANIGTLALTSLTVSSLTVPVLNASFANMTSGFANTFQAISLITTLATVTNANVSLLNSSSANITGATIGTLNVSSANLTTVTTPTVVGTVVNATTLNSTTGNITNLTVVQINASSANLTTGTMAANPTTNLGIATKQYVDGGAGGNLISRSTFAAKGDLIAGTGANTYGLLSAGSNGQTLIVDTTQTSGLRYASRTTSVFHGLQLGTSQADKVANGQILVVYKLDEAVMNDGEVVSGWTPRSEINVLSSGVNGLDTGTLLANTWYEVYAIRQRSTGTKGFLIHRAPDRNPDQNTANTGYFANVAAGFGVNTQANITIAMSFTPNVSGNVTSVEVRAYKTSTPTGNVWISLHANTAGSPNSIALATSRSLDVGRIQGSPFYPMRFVFDNAASVTAGTSYFWKLTVDYVNSATAYLNVAYSVASPNGVNLVNPGVPMANNGSSWVNLTPGIGTFVYKVYVEANSTAVTMPSGYDQSCLISYMATDPNSKIREYRQFERTIYPFYSAQWMGHQITYNNIADVADFRWVLPPVPVSATFFAVQTSSVTRYLGWGILSCTDIPGATIVETYGYMPGSSSGGTIEIAQPPSPVMWIEHQASYVRVSSGTTTLVKLYPQSFTF